MLRRLNYSILRSLAIYFQSKYSTNHVKRYFSNGTRLLIASHVWCTALRSENHTKIDIDDGLRKACEEGDVAIIKLMSQLKEFVVVVSKEYRTCLTKQIEITVAASNLGPLSEVWDELPQYRILADELQQELNDYIALFNTIGQMTYDESLIQFVAGSNKDLINAVSVKYKELELLLKKEFEENKKIENELLEIKRDSILKGANG